ncbi:hypothetical protein K469DRAFT_685236 [Zopfia rhizophila CBS 207.26]|uniref:CHAT domain-containing protein n=1 Tax=Zopfia rhizophila CBS 207.26 TaxID=1314779 RepID=A0A6A6D985_9PEZI|nr:hypothetical protein K469DRAFT_685236 [Zopfia rhizophila CBS 207.26]
MGESRAESLKEAQRLRKLGCYPEAYVQFCKASEQHDDLSLAVEVARMFLEQGYVKKSLEKINKALDQFRDTTSDQEVLALAEILQTAATASMTMRFSGPLKIGAELYNRYLLRLRAEQYEERMVTLLTVYLLMTTLAETCGFDITVPRPSLGFLQSLHAHLINKEQFAQALQIARIHGAMAGPRMRTKLLEEFLAVHHLPDLIKADGLAEFSGSLYGQDLRDEAIAKLETAKMLYQKTGHATGPLLMEVQRYNIDLNGPDPQSHNKKNGLFRLKEDLERYQHYWGVNQVLQCLYRLAQLQQDDMLRVELDRESISLAEIRGLDWIAQQYFMMRQWEMAGPSAGQLLQPLEAIYETLLDTEAPVIRSAVASALAKVYQGLGDTVNAEKWVAEEKKEPTAVPRYARFLVGKDAFIQELERATAGPNDAEGEVQDLRRELRQVLEDVDVETTPTDSLYLGIMKVTNICDLYIDKFKLRGFAQTKRLVETCLEQSNALVQFLPTSQKKKWEAAVMLVKARLLFIQANTCGRPEPKVLSDIIDQGVLSQSIKAYEKAESLYQAAAENLSAAGVQQQLANCYRQMWYLHDKSPTSPAFGLAVEKYETSREMMGRLGSTSLQRSSAAMILSHWYQGYMMDTRYSRPRPFCVYLGLGFISTVFTKLGVWKWLRLLPWLKARRWWFFKSPFEEVVSCLIECERLIDSERQDLSALGYQEAILAKQNMRQDQYVNLIYEIGPALFRASGHAKELWEWVQRSKARSLSDLLGLGVNIPTELRERIYSDPQAVALLAREEALVKQVRSATPAAQLFARKELETHRQVMRAHDNLRELLDIRKGTPVPWSRLQQLSISFAGQKTRRTWFIDWLTSYGAIFIIAVSDEKEWYHIFRADMTLEEVNQWIKDNLDHRGPLNGEDDEAGFAALALLKKLVSPIIDITEKDDLLVLCMTASLHRVPVHAAIIEGDPDEDDSRRFKTLIERNPVIYASSMTIFEQCMNRSPKPTEAVTASNGPQTHEGVVLGVYEDATEGWESERERVYDTCRGLSQRMQWGDAICGVDVGKSKFQAACRADIVHFSGHFHYDTPNVLAQGIVLAAQEASKYGQVETTASEIPKADSNGIRDQSTKATEPPPERVFSVADMFSTKVTASHFSLIGCGSASQAIQLGDEPLSIIVALLCAGARSVAGTLWPIASSAGRAFSEHFYRPFEPSKDERHPMDLAIALQQAVREMRKDEDMAAPYFWAGFVLHGAWCYKGDDGKVSWWSRSVAHSHASKINSPAKILRIFSSRTAC